MKSLTIYNKAKSSICRLAFYGNLIANTDLKWIALELEYVFQFLEEKENLFALPSGVKGFLPLVPAHSAPLVLLKSRAFITDDDQFCATRRIPIV